jgi:hypothetical protein
MCEEMKFRTPLASVSKNIQKWRLRCLRYEEQNFGMRPEAFNVLEHAGLPAKQACAVAQAVEIECTAAHASLATRNDVVNLRAEMREIRSELRTEMHEIKSDIIRWVFLVILGQTAVLAGAGYFYINLLAR